MSGKALTFKYKKLPNGILRPIIRVEVCTRKTSSGVPCEVLVDSGADFCILKAEIAEVLGIDVKAGEPFSYRGVTGHKSVGYVHSIWLSVKNVTFKSKIVFSYDLPKGGHQVVGQVGFFDKFKVNFDYKNGSIVLRA